jgi:hypothetical protein
MVPSPLVVAAALVVMSQAAQRPKCDADFATPGGEAILARFFEASLPRTREAVEDAMQMVGVVLFESSDAVVRGERSEVRVDVLKLPHGDEAVLARLQAAQQDGRAGTFVQVETRRRGGNQGQPKHTWSSAVLNGTAFLLDLLSKEPPTAPTASPVAGVGREHEVVIPAGTVVPLVLRRFAFSRDLRVGQKLAFEIASDVIIGPDVVFLRGARGVARVTDVKDEGGGIVRTRIEFGSVVARGGGLAPVQAVFDIGRTTTVKDVLWLNGAPEIALCAGTRFDVAVKNDLSVRVADR